MIFPGISCCSHQWNNYHPLVDWPSNDWHTSQWVSCVELSCAHSELQVLQWCVFSGNVCPLVILWHTFCSHSLYYCQKNKNKKRLSELNNCTSHLSSLKGQVPNLNILQLIYNMFINNICVILLLPQSSVHVHTESVLNMLSITVWLTMVSTWLLLLLLILVWIFGRQLWINLSWVSCIVILYNSIFTDCIGLLLVIVNHILAWFDSFVKPSAASLWLVACFGGFGCDLIRNPWCNLRWLKCTIILLLLPINWMQ